MITYAMIYIITEILSRVFKSNKIIKDKNGRNILKIEKKNIKSSKLFLIREWVVSKRER